MSPTPPDRSAILAEALHVITKDRQDAYGNAEDSFALIARLWSNWLAIEVSPYDVAMMMSLLKIARARSNPAHTDNLVDLCGYAALAGEMTA